MKRTIHILAAALALYTNAAMAQQQCGPRAELADVLADRYGETAQAMGISAAGNLVDIFANEDTGTWTIVATGPEGVSCSLADGDSWSSVAMLEKQGERM